MSCPTKEQVESLLNRVRDTLEEWDDAKFALAIKCDDGDWLYLTRANSFQRMVVARGFLEESIKQCLEYDPEIDS